MSETQTTLESRVMALVLESIEDESYFPVKLVVRGFKGSRAVDVFIDADEGAAVDELAAIARRLRFLIDSEEAVEGKYSLTVSSPGDQYAFELPRQYGKHVGKTLEVKYADADQQEETATVRGSLKEVADGHLEIDPSGGELTTIQIDRITKAKVVLPW